MCVHGCVYMCVLVHSVFIYVSMYNISLWTFVSMCMCLFLHFSRCACVWIYVLCTKVCGHLNIRPTQKVVWTCLSKIMCFNMLPYQLLIFLTGFEQKPEGRYRGQPNAVGSDWPGSQLAFGFVPKVLDEAEVKAQSSSSTPTWENHFYGPRFVEWAWALGATVARSVITKTQQLGHSWCPYKKRSEF